MKNILVIVAHPDDEIIGLGGTLHKHILQKDRVEVLILGDGKSSRQKKFSELDDDVKQISTKETTLALNTLGIERFYKKYLPDNRFDTIALLDIIKFISSRVANNKPQIIYTHHYGDINVDHKITSTAVVTASRPTESPFVEEIRMFETLSSTEIAGYDKETIFKPNLFINIEKELKIKLKAMSYYSSELHEFPHPRSLQAIKYNARLWGTKNNISAAEAFHVFRSIKNQP